MKEKEARVKFRQVGVGRQHVLIHLMVSLVIAKSP